MREGDALPTVEKLVTQTQIEKYATASGDFNPLHIDHEFAATSQFGGTIAHGMMVAASISEMMTTAFGEDWMRGGRMKIRFRAPVYPGETITAFGQIKDITERNGIMQVTCSVGVKKQNEDVAINGDAALDIKILH